MKKARDVKRRFSKVVVTKGRAVKCLDYQIIPINQYAVEVVVYRCERRELKY